MTPGSLWETINAVTLATSSINASIAYYQKLGLQLEWYSPDFATVSPHGSGKDSMFVNLFLSPTAQPRSTWNGWGRAVFYVSDVDAVYGLALRNGLTPEHAPRDADWGERYFHILDPSGHELAIATPIGHRQAERATTRPPDARAELPSSGGAAEPRRPIPEEARLGSASGAAARISRESGSRPPRILVAYHTVSNPRCGTLSPHLQSDSNTELLCLLVAAAAPSHALRRRTLCAVARSALSCAPRCRTPCAVARSLSPPLSSARRRARQRAAGHVPAQPLIKQSGAERQLLPQLHR